MLELLRRRATVTAAIRRFFAEGDFIEVETPSIVPSPGLDLHLTALEVRDPQGGLVGWLATSPEYQMKRLLSAGATRIFQLCHSYRAEEHGAHHEREFSMLEWYRSHASSDDVMRDTERLIAHVADALEAPSAAALSSPWARLTVEEAFRRYADEVVDPSEEERFFRVWVEQVQPELGRDRPVFVTHWPSSMASLAKLNADGTADRFEGFFRGIELCNGFGELTDPEEQQKRFERDQANRRACGRPVYPIDERFLQALRAGMPESGGNALGVDRLIMLLSETDTIQAVMPFPVDEL